MKLIYVTILFLGSYLQVFSQKFNIGITLNPSYSGRIINFSKTTFNEEEIVIIKDRETLMPFINGGFFIRNQFKNLGLSLGINYLHTGFRTIRHNDLPTNPSVIGNAFSSEAWYRYHFLEFPLNIDFKKELSSKIHLHAIFGVSLISGIDYKRYIYSYRDGEYVGSSIREKPLAEYKKNNIGNSLQLGLSIDWSRSFSTIIGPSFKFFYFPFETLGENINYINITENTKGNFYHIGFHITLLYFNSKKISQKGIEIYEKNDF